MAAFRRQCDADVRTPPQGSMGRRAAAHASAARRVRTKVMKRRTPAGAGVLFLGPFGPAYCWTGACCCGSGSWACVLPIGAEATSLVHTSWNTTRLSGVYSLVRQVQRGAAATAGVTA